MADMAGMARKVTAIYDEQCEICQAMVSWIRFLDHKKVITCVPIDPVSLRDVHPDLDLDACLRVLHVIAKPGEKEHGDIYAAWDAVVTIANELPLARPLIWLDKYGPGRRMANWAYNWLAHNRYELSKCRGGACSVERPAETKRLASMRVFWTCYNLGFVFRLPLIAWHSLRSQANHVIAYASTRRQAFDLLDGKLQILFLGGLPTDLVPLVFGERFTAIVYRGILVDPGSVKMRSTLMAHKAAGRLDSVMAVTATHHHEEHSGNLDWAADLLDVSLLVAPAIAAKLRPPAELPRIRRFFIGQPPALSTCSNPLGNNVEIDGVVLEVIPALGHCDDHIVLWDPDERALLVGDAFMGAYFSSPNPDVDSNAWIETLERLIALGPEIMIEGHGHIHTLRSDVPDISNVTIRQDPVAALEEKLALMRWVREQVESGLDEGLEVHAIEATCFPWGRDWSWENVVADETARLMTRGEFSRSELVRSFRRSDDSAIPDVIKIRMAVSEPNSQQ